MTENTYSNTCTTTKLLQPSVLFASIIVFTIHQPMKSQRSICKPHYKTCTWHRCFISSSGRRFYEHLLQQIWGVWIVSAVCGDFKWTMCSSNTGYTTRETIQWGIIPQTPLQQCASPHVLDAWSVIVYSDPDFAQELTSKKQSFKGMQATCNMNCFSGYTVVFAYTGLLRKGHKDSCLRPL